MPTVANIRDLPESWLTDDRYVYVGRPGRGMTGYFGNPFVLNREHDRGRVLGLYRNYFLRKLDEDEAFRRRVLALCGKVLVCYCAPLACHADVIAEWLELQPEREDPTFDYAGSDQ